MANIFGFTLKGLKIVEGVYSLSLYYQETRLGKIEFKDNNYHLDWVKKIIGVEKEEIYKIAKNYFKKYPKLIVNKDKIVKDKLLIELTNDLVILETIEGIFSMKRHRKENTSFIKLSYHSRKTEEYKTEKIVSCKDWIDEYSEKITTIFRPTEFVVYKSLDDFIILS